jgi:hypothetical protein
VGAGQDPSAEDLQIVRDQLQPLLEELAQQDVYFIADVEAIPELSFLPLAYRLAAEVSADFGLGAVDQMTLNKLNERLRRTWITGPSYAVQTVEYF